MNLDEVIDPADTRAVLAAAIGRSRYTGTSDLAAWPHWW
jgi:hypothetical protein